LDHLQKVEGGQATLHRRAPVFTDNSDFINDALPLSNSHQGLMAPPTWSGGPGHRKGTESSKLHGSAHLSALSTWLGGPGHRKGTESSKLPSSTHLSALSTWSGRPRHRKSTESSKLPGSAHLSDLSTWSGGLGDRMGTEPSKLPDPSPLFCATNLDKLSGLEPFQEGRTLDSSTTILPLRGHLVTHRRLL
jgi:hypothetical protein